MEPTILNEDWAFEADETCVTLLKRHVTQSGDKKGTEYFRPAGYYNNFPQLLAALVDKDVQNLSNLEMVSTKVEELKQIIKKYMCQACTELFLKDLEVSDEG